MSESMEKAISNERGEFLEYILKAVVIALPLGVAFAALAVIMSGKIEQILERFRLIGT